MKRISSAICAAASIIGLAFIPGIPLGVTFGIVALSLLCLILLLVPESKEKLTVCKSDEEIRKYMIDWIKQKGQVKILSRDLSWVDSAAKCAIRRKSRDITVYAQNETELTREFSQAGIRVVLYGKLPYEPVTRFTIIRANKPDKQIAIAKTCSTKKGKFQHTIYQTGIEGDDKDKWIISLAQDLTNLLDASMGIERHE